MMTPEQLQHGKIYKIVCNITNEVYIGSTCSTLEKRLNIHRRKNNHTVSTQILERGDYDIILVQEYPCETKQELLWCERHYFDIIECINIIPPIVSAEEAEIRMKESREDNKEKHAAYMKQYRVDNAEQIKKNKAKWQVDHKEMRSASNKVYRAKNVEAIKLKQAAVFQKLKANIKILNCGCGGTYNDRGSGSKNRHEKSKKHLKWVADSLA